MIEITKDNLTKFAYGRPREFDPRNMKSPFFPHDEEENGWTDPILYETNSYGFRTKEFEECRDSIIFLGCSHTYGIGLPSDRIWCHLVAKELGLPYFNLSVAAGSLDTAFRVLSEWMPVVKSKMVFLQIPEARREVVWDESNLILRILATNKHVKNFHIMLNDVDYGLNRKKNLLAIEKICELHDSKFITLENTNFVGEMRARDKLHYGYDFHEHFAKVALSEYRQ